MLTVLTVILMIRLPPRPSRPKAMSMPSTRRNVCARRRRPASARGFLGQPVLPLDMPSPLRSAPARRRAALPVHELRSTMISRTQAATESMIVDLRLAAQARAKVPAGQNAVFILVAQLAKSSIREPHAPPHPAGRPGCAAGLELKI